MSSARVVHVAVAVIRDEAGRVLVAQRQAHQHLAGLWEFPGGKLEPGESLQDGMQREIREELGIAVDALAPLLRIEHSYPEKTVLLDVWRVLRWHGSAPVAQGAEGQRLRWLHPQEMNAGEFPPADVPIIRALNLPPHYAITPDLQDAEALRQYVDTLQSKHQHVRLLQVRLKHSPSLAPLLLAHLRAAFPAATLLLNSETCALLDGSDDFLAGFRALTQADGVHLTARHLLRCGAKPVDVCAASCHDAAELAQAFRLGLDFATLSPVCVTASHPNAPVLGWKAFAALAAGAGLPCYALGGVAETQRAMAIEHGAIGIAGITAFSEG
jgi:8-oxo-dGTP diphosphatase